MILGGVSCSPHEKESRKRQGRNQIQIRDPWNWPWPWLWVVFPVPFSKKGTGNARPRIRSRLEISGTGSRSQANFCAGLRRFARPEVQAAHGGCWASQFRNQNNADRLRFQRTGFGMPKPSRKKSCVLLGFTEKKLPYESHKTGLRALKPNPRIFNRKLRRPTWRVFMSFFD